MSMSQPPSSQLMPVALLPAIEDVLTLIAEEARQHHVHMHHDIQPDPVWLLADDAELRQVFINLVHNAIHAMPGGGELRIRGCPQDERLYRIEVSDTGVGISPDNLSRIFLPFFSRRADGQAGMGLGLAVTKSIVTRFGGDIRVGSVQGQGSVFTLVLQRYPPPAGDAPESVP
jgi:signal transduction histidine kinase